MKKPTDIFKEVSFVDAEAVYLDPGIEIGPKTHIYPNVVMEGKTVVGKGCFIGPGVVLQNAVIGDGANILAYSVIEDSTVGKGTRVGPFAHIRPGSVVAAGARVGNFVELKKTRLGEGSKANHLSYLGDAEIGKDVNVGAGTITCNYDGFAKYKTILGDRVFVGSDVQFVAPVKVGDDGWIGAGSTVTKDVPAGALAVSRPEQKNVEGWTKRKMREMKKAKD